MYWIINHHGTAGMGQSFGFAEVVRADERPQSSETQSVSGPYKHKSEAEARASRDEIEYHDRFRRV